MSGCYQPGELFVYVNGDRWELGMVKRPGNGDGYFCWYSRGDTAANTPTSCMHKLSNAGFTHIEQLLDAATVGMRAKDRDWCPMGLSGTMRCEGPDPALKAENERLRRLLSSALISAGHEGRQFLDAYLREEEGTTLWQELKSLGIEVDE